MRRYLVSVSEASSTASPTSITPLIRPSLVMGNVLTLIGSPSAVRLRNVGFPARAASRARESTGTPPTSGLLSNVGAPEMSKTRTKSSLSISIGSSAGKRRANVGLFSSYWMMPRNAVALLSSDSSKLPYRNWRSARYTPALNTARITASRRTYHNVSRTRMDIAAGTITPTGRQRFDNPHREWSGAA